MVGILSLIHASILGTTLILPSFTLMGLLDLATRCFTCIICESDHVAFTYKPNYKSFTTLLSDIQFNLIGNYVYIVCPHAININNSYIQANAYIASIQSNYLTPW